MTGSPANREAFSYRQDPSVPTFPDDLPIIIFDGKCVLCSAFAQFVMRTDKKKSFRMMAAQTPTGSALYRHYDLPDTNFTTNILLQDGLVWIKSEASIRIVEQLGFPYSFASVGRLIPCFVRDRIYGVIARNRIKWFGDRSTCFTPDLDQADRFVQ
jgi:predicted DCC family thiol-disulfide oxidoreductase YuxK